MTLTEAETRAASFRIIHGSARQVLATLPDGSVNCCVTSPPYWGLRDYETAKWDGGDAGCDHRSPTMREGRNENRPKLAGSAATNSAQLILAAHSRCGKCGATRIDDQLGLERTPEEYTAAMVDVFREVRRVLRDDGTLWLNLGDSYAGGKVGNTNGLSGSTLTTGTTISRRVDVERMKGEDVTRGVPAGLKPKDLVGIPWRVAFALQSDGWYLRSDIIWHMPNPMPESVTDRPTKSHEYLFLLTKSEKYWYDAGAIAEEATCNRMRGPALHADLVSTNGNGGLCKRETRETRNKRTVWTIPTHPYPEAHFATFPPALVEPCIRGGCPAGGTVLDPFSGSGTTGMVALRHGRDYIGIELNADYVAMSRRRIMGDNPLFNVEALS